MEFKIGDKVKVLYGISSVNQKGDIGFVTEIEDGLLRVNVKNREKTSNWHMPYQLELLKEEYKMEIIKFKPTNYEYVEGVHCFEFHEGNLIWIYNQPNSLTWGNRSILRIQMNNEGNIINKGHSFYFQLADGTKKIFKIGDLMKNSDLEERLVKYLVDYENENEYLCNLMQASDTDGDELKTLLKAYEEVEQTIYKTVNLFKDDKVTKVKEHEINELIFEIEQMNLENAINKALDENDKESFMKLTGGVE